MNVREAPKQIRLSMGGPRVKTRDIVIFTRQFATMINAGLPLVQSLNILAAQTENKTLARRDPGGGVRRRERQHAGRRLLQAPKAFTQLYVNMVAAGEAGGILDTILLRLATFLEKNDALVRKVKGAMIYPGVIITVAVGAIAILLVFVIPTFQSMFASANLELPLPTRVVIGMSNFLIGYWWAILLRDRRRSSSPSGATTPPRPGRLQIDGMLLKAPVLGDVIRKSAVSRFTRTLGTLVSSGVSILEGLEITAKTAGNQVVHDAVMESRQVDRGR